MIRCARCGVDYPVGTLFCLQCGGSLVERSLTSRADPVAQVAGSPGMSQLTLYLPSSRRSIEIGPLPEVILGRADMRTGMRPDIDLTPNEGQRAGVSRRHAAIQHKDGQFAIVDLGSANGTFHNGRQLQPSEPSRLSNGDEIRLGSLVLRVHM